MNGKRFGYVLLTVAVTVLATLALLRLPKSAKKPETSPQREVTIAQAGDFFLYAPLYVALDAGFFAKQGLDVRIVSTGGDDKTWAAVVSGSASFGVADPTFVAVSAQRGQPGRVVASIVNGAPFWGVTFRKDIPLIQDPRGLQGYTVATFPAPSTAYTLQKRMFDDAHLRVRIQQGAFGSLLAMLEAKKADIALELEPNVSQAVARGAHVVYSLAERYGDFAVTGLTTTPQVLSSDPTLVRQTTCALQQSLDLLRLNSDSALVILRHRFPDIDSSVASAALARVIKERIVPTSVHVAPRAWEEAVKLRVASGDLAAVAPFDGFVDTTFAALAWANCRLRN